MPKSYSGCKEFTFEIERYKNIKTKEYFSYKQISPEQVNNEDLYEYEVIELTVSGSGHHRPGKYYGPWEDSYPDDSECEIESIVDSSNNDWSAKITDSEMSDIEEKLMEKIMDSSDDYSGPDYDDHYDDYRDDYYY